MLQPATHEVVDGVYTIPFTGRRIGDSTTEKRIPYPSLRWVEMELFAVEPGQQYCLPDDPDEDLLKLPDGGYLCHIVGQSVVYHQHDAGCGGGGVPTRAIDSEIDVLPCPDCKPPRLWNVPRDGAVATLRPGVSPDMLVELETARHSIQRGATAAQIVRSVIGSRLSTPAQKLLEIARRNDPRIDAYLGGRPRP